MNQKPETGCIVDRRETIALSKDYIAATAIMPNGVPILVLGLATADENVRFDPLCEDVAHEQLGRLPRPVMVRIHGDAMWCGRPTKAGTPCRNEVRVPGGACARHDQPAHIARAKELLRKLETERINSETTER